MDHIEGASSERGDRVDFDRRLRLEFRGAQISSDGGLLVMRELDDTLGLSDLASAALRDTRMWKNTVHRLDGLFRQSVFGRLAGYEDVNNADRLALDPVMRQVVGGRAVDAQAASPGTLCRLTSGPGSLRLHTTGGWLWCRGQSHLETDMTQNMRAIEISRLKNALISPYHARPPTTLAEKLLGACAMLQ